MAVLKKKLVIPLLVLSVLIVSGSLCLLMLGAKANAGEDLHELQEMGAQQSYSTLVQAVQSKSASTHDFVFVVLGDSRANMEIARAIYSRAASENPAFILHTGDLVRRGTVEEYLHYHLPLVKQIMPVALIPVPGNHERGPDKNFAGFRAIYGALRFSFDYGVCRFVGINHWDAEGLSDENLHFLDQELSRGGGAATEFVIMHVPPVFVEKEGNGAGDNVKYRGFTSNADAFRELMQRHHVRGVFFGHDHGFASHVIDGVRYTITAGAGAELYSELNWVRPIHHYLVVHVTPQGVWQELVRLDGDQWVRSRVE